MAPRMIFEYDHPKVTTAQFNDAAMQIYTYSSD
jgi:hypothetical protein